MEPNFVRTRSDGVVLLAVRVQPRSSHRGPAGLHGASLKWGVGAAPVDGKANAELCEAVAVHFGIPKSCVSISRGESSREKILALAGVSTDEILAKVGHGGP